MSKFCCYQDCLSIKYPCGTITFFALPTDHRRQIWIKNSANKDLLGIGPEAKRFLCEKHFRECDIRSSFNRKILRKQAIPFEHPSVRSNEGTVLRPELDECERITDKVDENQQNTEDIEFQDQQAHYEIISSITTNETELGDGHETDSIALGLIDYYETESNDESFNGNTLLEMREEEEKFVPAHDEQSDNSLEIYVDDNNSFKQVCSLMTDDLEEMLCLENDKDITSNTKVSKDQVEHMPAKRRCTSSEMESTIVDPPPTQNEQPSPDNAANSYEEDKHFALSLVGYFQRLPQGKKAMAKLKILQYLTELEMDLPAFL